MTPPHFHIFVIISPLNRTWPFIWTNLNSLYLRIICTKFDWIWSAGFGEEHFFLNFSAFSLFHYYLPLEESYPLYLNKLESPLPKDWSVLSLVKIGSVVLMIFKWPFSIFTFCDYLPFEEDLVLYLKKLEFPLPKDDLYQVWLNLTCYFWRRFLKIFSAFLLFRCYLPLEKGDPLHMNKL
jgi:hypothetical protein